MPRISRDARLETRDARRKLKARHSPYWRTVHPGLAIGYRRSAKGGTWKVRYLDGESYRFGSLGTADDHADADGISVLSYKDAHKLALEFAERCENHDDAQEEKPAAGHYTVGQAMQDYLSHHKAHGKSADRTDHTIKAHILPTFENRPVAALTAREIQRWQNKLITAPIRQRGKKAVRKVDPDNPDAIRKRKATANRVLTVLKAGLNHAYHNGVVKSADAWRRVKPFRGVDVPKVRYLSEDECRRLLNACDADLRALVRGALQTGCRFGELARMRANDFNPDGGTVTVREAKGGKARHVPLTEAGIQAFELLTADLKGDDLIFTRSDGEPWGKDYYQRPLREACGRASIDPPASFHVLRHTYGSALALRGVPLQVIAYALGHSDTRMTERHYAHLQPSYAAETIRAHLPSYGDDKPAKVRKLRKQA